MRPRKHYTTYQLKMPVDIEKNIEISDAVFTLAEVIGRGGTTDYLFCYDCFLFLFSEVFV